MVFSPPGSLTHLVFVAKRAEGELLDVFLQPGSTFSIFSLLFAFAVSATFLVLRRRWNRGSLPRFAALLRALFPKWIWRSASSRADMVLFLLNTLATGAIIGWALFSYSVITSGSSAILSRVVGSTPLAVSPLIRDAAVTVLCFFAYEIAYWLDHYLMHRIPLFWEFHRVHHTAERLTPLTVFRVHPVDSLIFYNILALAVGSAHGAAAAVFGGAAHETVLSGTNIILLIFIFATVHLQHSHINIRFKGLLGRLFLSPVHHHIHHSTSPEHFNRNLGSCLAIWDWLFGTLVIPDKSVGRLNFGVGDTENDRYTPHSVAGTLVMPFIRAIKAPRPEMPLGPTAGSATPAYCPPG
jgi:sterol desaturase/sphingolipid hydroxylase (fatty acid hydroxylase superfamily)